MKFMSVVTVVALMGISTRSLSGNRGYIVSDRVFQMGSVKRHNEFWLLFFLWNYSLKMKEKQNLAVFVLVFVRLSGY